MLDPRIVAASVSRFCLDESFEGPIRVERMTPISHGGCSATDMVVSLFEIRAYPTGRKSSLDPVADDDDRECGARRCSMMSRHPRHRVSPAASPMTGSTRDDAGRGDPDRFKFSKSKATQLHDLAACFARGLPEGSAL
jgi:hypothetical protein